MSGQVWKFRLPSPNEEPFVIVPKRSKFLHVAAQDGIPYVWALVDPKGDLCRRHVVVYATGEAIDGSPDYLGTFHIDWTVWHVFTTYGDLPIPPHIGRSVDPPATEVETRERNGPPASTARQSPPPTSQGER